MAKRKHTFATIRSEGAILPPDLLQRIAGLEVEGIKPKDYHLPAGLKINEEISRAWNRLQAYWKGFADERERIPDSDSTGGVTTRDKWLLPLFQELGYGRLTTSKAPELDGRSYPIERFYGHTPLHLIGCKLPLDKRTPGARGAATASPHSIVQEFLNRSDDHLWAFLSNGLQLRILRDNYSLSRQSYVEFDLQAMMDGELYADFALLWLLCHQSRVESDKPDQCWLEKWSKLAHEQGTRVLEHLREGVQKAIESLGVGFLAHRQNAALRQKLQAGDLSTQDYYRQLLRIVYRLLFLFVAEDRELLHSHPAEDATEDDRRQHELACEVYDQHYSLRRLRDLAERVRGSKHADLWHTLSLVFDALARPTGLPQLALPGLGSFLWGQESTADLLGPIPDPPLGRPEPVLIANHHLLDAVRALAFTVQNRTLRAVDYKNLGSEELGSVYESLLELVPEINTDGRSFALRTAAGSERKTTGSYYTPDSLVQCLLDSALESVVADRLKPCRTDVEREDAILNLKVCDPAVGSGHFLIAAAHRLARHLSRIRSGESEPTPDVYQTALRDVIRRCVFGVDINPMAAELCKVALWMESIDPGKPLTFLDAHIQVGNSLLGTTPRLMAEGIPDDSFKPIEGDDKKVCADLKKQNKKERKDFAQGQDNLFEPFMKLGNLPGEFTRLSSTSDDSVADVAEKERRYAELVSGADYQNARLLADTWCAVFVWKKNKSDLGKQCPTENDFRRIENNPRSILPHVKSEVRRLADQYQFFHWHLAFPDVFRLPGEDKVENEDTGWNGGFDMVLGNPPWEKILVEDIEFFASRDPEIAALPGARRKKAIHQLAQSNPSLNSEWLDHRRQIASVDTLVKQSGRFPHSGKRQLNTYALFAELSHGLIGMKADCSLVLPLGLVTDHGTRDLFSYFALNGYIRAVLGFENEEFIFPTVHHAFKFCIFHADRVRDEHRQMEFAFFARSVAELNEPNRRFNLSPSDIQLLNPNTGTCPIFKFAKDFAITRHAYHRYPVIDSDTGCNAWALAIHRCFHSTDDSALMIELEPNERRPPTSSYNGRVVDAVYEGKMFHQYDHRFGTYVGQTDSQRRQGKLPELTAGQHADAELFAQPRWWVDAIETERKLSSHLGTRQWTFAFRDVTSPVVIRTAIASILPRIPTVDLRFVFFPREIAMSDCCNFLAVFNSFVFDFVTRQKFSGNHLSTFIVRQLPMPSPGLFSVNGLNLEMVQRVLELTYTAWDLEAFALDCGYDGPPFRWDEERRFLLRCELDAAYFHLYLGASAEWGTDSSQLRKMFPTPRDAVDYILDTFPIVRKKDEKAHGSYRTKDTILEIYDQMAEAQRTGQPFVSALNPPPGPPADEAGNFIPVAQWDDQIWQRYQGVIHPPREAELRPAAAATVGTRAPVGAGGFPDNERDRLLVAAALALVGPDGIDEETHLDAMILMAAPERCRALCANGTDVDATFATVPNGLADDGVRWAKVCSYLETGGIDAIKRDVHSGRITRGEKYAELVAHYPSGLDELATLAMEAANALQNASDDVKHEQEQQRQIERNAAA